jgi:hypothetical protein
MKRALLALLLCGIFVITMQGQYVTIEGRQFKDENGDDFYPVVCNYIVNYFFNKDTSDFFLSPQSDGWGYECDGATTCDTQFYHNFLQLKHMKFNSIRLFGANPLYVDTLNGFRSGFRIDAFHNTTTIPDPDPVRHFYLNSPYQTDSISHKIFTLIDRMLVQANHAGLKVILVTGGAKYKFYPKLDTAYYSEFLTALSHHIANHSPQEARNALMAYDLLNEPYSSDQTGWPWSDGHYKKDVCNRVANWYNAVKPSDSCHLVTMGAGGVDDILEYDLSVMKLDFASPHLYPRKTTYEPDSARFTAMMNRVHGILYWIGKNCQMPFLIGETGFSAQENIQPDSGTHEDTSEQRQYAEITLQQTRDCFGSGYSWWKYQNADWGSVYENNFGLLNDGFCTPRCYNLEKPVVKAFENFNASAPPNTCYPPTNYFDPWNYKKYSLDTITHTIQGNVRDSITGVAIRDAVVFGKTCLGLDNNNKPIDDLHFTFTDSLGNFKITPYNFLPPFDTNQLSELYVSAPGAKRICKKANDPEALLKNNDEYQLMQQRWDFNGELGNDTIHNGEFKTFQGWYLFDVTNVTIEAGSEVNINARHEINANSFFDARVGSEVMIDCIPTFPICTDYEVFQKKAFTMIQQGIAAKEIPLAVDLELSFLLNKNDFKFFVFPNPGNGLFTVNMTCCEQLQPEFNVDVINLIGGKIVSLTTKEMNFNIDLSSFTKGVYFIKISTDSFSKTQKIIIQ